MNVIEEKSLKHRKKINLTYFLFCTSCYQLLTALFLFWVDIIPGFGFDKGIHEFGKRYHCEKNDKLPINIVPHNSVLRARNNNLLHMFQFIPHM